MSIQTTVSPFVNEWWCKSKTWKRIKWSWSLTFVGAKFMKSSFFLRTSIKLNLLMETVCMTVNWNTDTPIKCDRQPEEINQTEQTALIAKQLLWQNCFLDHFQLCLIVSRKRLQEKNQKWILYNVRNIDVKCLQSDENWTSDVGALSTP